MMLANILKGEIGNQCIENNKIICNQYVKRTGVDQMCHVAIIFNLLKQIEKQTTLKDIPFYSLFFVIDAIFSELKEIDKLYINANKVRILKDFLAHFRYILDETCM